MESLHLTQGPQIPHCVQPWPSKNLRSTHAHTRKLPKHNPSQKNSAYLHTDTALVVLTTDISFCASPMIEEDMKEQSCTSTLEQCGEKRT